MFDNKPYFIHTYRPNMKFMDPTLDPTTARLKSMVGSDELYKDPACRTFNAKNSSWLSLDLTEDQVKSTIWAEADNDGDIVTDDPIVAYQVIKALEKCGPIKHPFKPAAAPIKYEVDKISKPLPTEAEYKKALEAREKELAKEAKK